MSVPLDRLYNFLDSVSNHALLIYGWRPHGSKKLKDLVVWRQVSDSWRERKMLPSMIFHDQEPLDYNFSQFSVDHELDDALSNQYDFELLKQPLMQKFYKTLNLQVAVLPSFYDSCLIVHSEKNSKEVVKFEQNNFVPVYYWSHALIARDWFRFAEHDTNLDIKSPCPKTFLVYNRAWTGSREYRLKFSEQLVSKELHRDCITSFSKTDTGLLYTDHVFRNEKFKINRADLETVLPPNTHESIASADYNYSDYQNSLIEVVLETLFDDTRLHLTEKTLRPIAVGQPFILMAAAGSLQYIKDYGFKTFDGFIDESYDTIQDSLLRLQAVIQEMQRISQLTTKQKQQLIKDIQPMIKHNQRLFFSKQFHTAIVDEFKQNLDNAVATVKSGSFGQHRRQRILIAQSHYPELYHRYWEQSVDDTEWAEKWIQSNTKF
jgi:hypothetical protein